MGDAPPPRLAPRGRPTLITDLPTDVLSYIISLVPGDERYGRLRKRVRLSVVCRAFADAVRPPSAVWKNVHIVFGGEEDWTGLREQYNTPSQQGAYGTLERAMQVAGPAVRRFSFSLDSNEDEDLDSTRTWVERVLATTPHVQYAKADRAFFVEAPPPMVSAGRAAILDFWINDRTSETRDYLYPVLALHRRLVAVGRQAGSGAARTAPVLASMYLDLTQVRFWDSGSLQSLRSFATAVGQHLTRLHLPIALDTSPNTAPTCLDHLPALRELRVGWCDEDPLDLGSVETPPRALTRLVVDSWSEETVLLPPAIMARLEVLELSCRRGGHERPPDCLRDAGNSFRRLTRLVYGGMKDSEESVDLAGWATPEFAVPTLVVLEARAASFRLDAADGPAWAATVASTTLPRLERLALFQWNTYQRLSGLAYGPVFEGSGGMPADAVAESITRSLPAAAAAAGRSLSVRVQHVDWRTVSGQVIPLVGKNLTGFLALKYEAPPVQ